MATIVQEPPRAAPRDSFYFRLSAVMAAIIVAGFVNQFLAGRSTFAARPLVHLHGVVFMGWLAIFVMQSWLASRRQIDLHRRLGRVATVWAALMVAVAFWIIVDVTQRGTAPFFFLPQHFLFANPLGLTCFVGLVGAAVRLRRQPEWHRRLQICATAAISGPGFGRLIPMPLLIPYAFEAAALCGLIFPAVGAVRDWRRDGRVHPAWWCGIAAIAVTLLIGRLVAFSPIGDAVYAWVTAGHPGAEVPGLAFPPPPPI